MVIIILKTDDNVKLVIKSYIAKRGVGQGRYRGYILSR